MACKTCTGLEGCPCGACSKDSHLAFDGALAGALWAEPETTYPLPARIVPDSDGGVTVEWRIGGHRVVYLEIHANGKAEIITFEDSKMVSRWP